MLHQLACVLGSEGREEQDLANVELRGYYCCLAGDGLVWKPPLHEQSLLFQLEWTERDASVFNEQRAGTWLESCFCIA